MTAPAESTRHAPTMNALQLLSYEGVGSIRAGKAARPVIAEPGHIIIRVRHAGLNPVDWQTSLGYLRAFANPALPFTLGWDAAGDVTLVGQDVNGFAVGDEVMVMLGLAAGGLAEYVQVPAAWVSQKPSNLTMVDASAVPLVALTAWQALFDSGGLKPGQHVLVHGAAGSVGRMAVQFAKLMGSRVTAVANSAHRSLLASWGVGDILTYDGAPFEQGVKDVDVVLDVIGGDIQTRSWVTLKTGGTLVSTVGVLAAHARDDVSSKSFGVKPNGEQLTQIAAMLRTGAVRPPAASVVALRDAPQALAEMQQRLRSAKTTVDLSL